MPRPSDATLELRKALGMPITEWARRRGFPEKTVLVTIRRWWGKDHTPHGGIARQIMAALREELEEVKERR